MTALALTHSDISVVSARGASTIRDLQSKLASVTQERDEALSKVASLEHAREVETIAREMEESGFESGLSFDEKVASLSQREDLTSIREAMKIATGGVRIASINTDDPSSGGTRSAALAQFEAFCLGGSA